jgi:hypothetical protein
MSKKANSASQSSKKRSTRAKTPRKAETCAPSPFEILCGEPEQINPAILLAEELMQKGIADVLNTGDLQRAEETLAFSRREIQSVETQFAALVKTPGAPASEIPVGF